MAQSVRRSSRDKSAPSTPSGLGVAVSLLREVMEQEGRIMTDPRNKLNEILIKKGVEYSSLGEITLMICFCSCYVAVAVLCWHRVGWLIALLLKIIDSIIYLLFSLIVLNG
jgi:hypothetical protein